MSENPSEQNDINEDQEMTMTRRGAQFLGDVNRIGAEERAKRLERWKADRTRLRAVKQQSVIVEAPTDNVVVTEGSSEDSSEEPPKQDVKVLNRSLLRQLILEKKWGSMCNQINQYQEELEVITKELRKEGKKCTGCALNPYRAKFATALGLDFKDPKVISEQEVQQIKEELNINLLQVGVSDGKVQVR